MDNLNFLNKNLVEKNLKNNLKAKIELNLYKNIDSTNDQAKKYLKNLAAKDYGGKNLIIFAADRQNAGRGRRGKKWFSNKPEGLAVTFLSLLENKIEEIPQITAAAALAVKDTLNFFELDSFIKWPNDILIKNKKIAGILSELVLAKNGQYSVIIGCGINLNNNNFNSKIKNKPTSYYLEKKKKINKNIFLAKLIEIMNFYIKSYSSESRREIINKWKEELELIGKKIDLSYQGFDYTVLVLDILDSGELLVELGNGQKKKLDSLNTSLYYNSLSNHNFK